MVGPADGGTVVLLAGPGDATDIVAHFLARRVGRLEVVVEAPPSRSRMARRRAARVGWPSVAGQVLFVGGALPALRHRDRARIEEIVAAHGLDVTPYRPVHAVASVNGDETVDLLRGTDPDVVVVNGTRIISPTVLTAIDRPFVNTHAGITPRDRGVHGGYWALAEGRPEEVGTTVHLVDAGIDTGGVLGQARFTVTRADSIATYPYLHLAAGLPLLGEAVDRVLAGRELVADPAVAGAAVSRLHYHPTVWGYAGRRLRHGVR